ncbi:MAG: ricin-type beta-trefoil lectin domain protein, partial [Streptosporangiaceae bacterium]
AAPAAAAPDAPRAAAALPAGAAAACPPAVTPGTMSCGMVTSASQSDTASTPAGLGPADLQGAYRLQSATEGTRQTIAVIGAGADPTAASDLAVYRSKYGLAPCTTGDGCLSIVNENGGPGLPGSYISNWTDEYALDLDIVSAICPNCHILLVEASSSNIADLATAANTAATTPGVHVVDNTYLGTEFSGETAYDSDYDHPGVAMTAAAGDAGYSGLINYPAASPYVTSVGGTVLTQKTTGGLWSDTSAWSGTVSGCSLYEPKPAWQKDPSCAGRADNDISAVAATGADGVVNPLAIAYYNSSNTTCTAPDCWSEGGGTAASADVIAGIYALAGTPAAGTNPASYPYLNPGGSYTTPGKPYPYDDGLNDITAGSTGTCSITYLCTAGAGYDAPTGLGAPASTLSLTASGGTTGEITFAQVPGYCLTNEDQTLANHNPIQVWGCTGKANSQQWTLEANGTIQIGSGWCISTTGAGTKNGDTVILYSCNGSAQEQWQVTAAGQLLNQTSGFCISTPSTSSDQMVIDTCDATSVSQRLTFPYPVPVSAGEISSQSSPNLCADDQGDKLTDGNPVDLDKCGGSAAQQWTIEANGQIQLAPGYCLNLDPDGPPAGSADLVACGSAAWALVIRSDGSISTYPPPDLGYSCLANKGGDSPSGTQIIFQSCGNPTGESWTLP